MSWCDKLGSTPTVGFKLSRHYAPVDVVMNSLAPILDRQTDAEARHTTLGPPQSLFSNNFTTNDGFRYGFDEEKLYVAFHHRVRYRQVSAGLPQMEMLSKPLPFTELIPIVSDKLIEATLLLPEANRKVLRAGVISTTPLAEIDAPPGIRKLIEYLGRPWDGALDYYNINVTSQITSNEQVLDQCAHILIKPEETDQLPTIAFDWTRTFKNPREISKSNLQTILQETTKGALKYFEDIAEGSRFDELVIRESNK